MLQLEKEIADRDRTLIVDFFATWCGPCLLLASELEKVAETLGDKVKVLKIDVDENPGEHLAARTGYLLHRRFLDMSLISYSFILLLYRAEFSAQDRRPADNRVHSKGRGEASSPY